jgi:hypothetical protein
VNAFERGIVGAYLAIALTCVIALLVRWIVREVRKGPGNKRTGLPPPSDACRRSPNWQAHEPRSPRGYVP